VKHGRSAITSETSGDANAASTDASSRNRHSQIASVPACSTAGKNAATPVKP